MSGEFKKYMHVERFGNDHVEGIELGECHIFTKLDGTNASLWCRIDAETGDLDIYGGSRNREVSIENDNQGFLASIYANTAPYLKFFGANPHLRLFGEWLVPHTLKTYRPECWNQFYVFDVFNDESQQYVAYDAYKPLLDATGINYLAPIAIIRNGSYEDFIHTLSTNVFYIEDGKGTGEGIVIKNYDYYNRQGQQIWAKIVTSEFKEQHYKEMGAPEREGRLLEELIAEKYVTTAEAEKTLAKIKAERDGWQSEYIPELLGRIYHDVVNENIWDICKEHNNPTINFKTLKALTFKQAKTLLPAVF